MSHFKEYVDGIVKMFSARLDEIEVKIDGYKKHVIDGREMIDNQDVCKVLKVGKRSLYRYRRSGELPYHKFGGKIYYDFEDLENLKRKIME